MSPVSNFTQQALASATSGPWQLTASSGRKQLATRSTRCAVYTVSLSGQVFAIGAGQIAPASASPDIPPAPALVPLPEVPPPEVPAPAVCGFEHSQVSWSKPGAGQGIGAHGLLEQDEAAPMRPAATKTVAKISSRANFMRHCAARSTPTHELIWQPKSPSL